MLAGVVEYANSTSVAEQDHYPNECPGYDTKPFNGEAPVLKPRGMWSTP